jgi:hypothetical protein
MNWYVTGDERRRAPREYQEHINRIGGLNRFGKPNFRLVWGQTETQVVYGTDANGRRGQHTLLLFGGIPAWHLLEWKPPETFGTARSWYSMTWDPEAQSHTLGDYPWHGLYMPCSFNLYVKRVEGGGIYYDRQGNVVEKPSKLVIDAMPLAHWVLDLIIPNIKKSLEMTHAQKVLVLKQRREAELAATEKRTMDAYIDASPAWGGGASSKESNRERWMQRLKEKQAGMKISAEQIQELLGKGHRQTGVRRK